MKNKYKTVLWGFFSLDYKAMETYLEEMARKGWMLKKVGRLTARFKAIEPQNLKFYVDVFKEGGPLTPENTKEAEEYRSLCQESGWNFITSYDYLQFFYTEGDKNPTPIQTDEALEQKIVESTLWKYEILGNLLALIVSIIILFKIYPLSHTNFLTFAGVAVTFLYPLLGIPLIFITAYNLIWMLKARKNIKRGFAIEKPTLKGARRRAIAYNVPLLINVLILLLAMVGDAFFMPHTSLMSLFSVALGLGIGFGLRYIIKKKIRDKRDSILYISLAFIIIIVVISIANSLLFGGNANYTGKKESIPEGYPKITIYELTGGDWKGELLNSEFSTRMSPITPEQYNYWETWDMDGTVKYLRVNYYKTIHPYFAEIIFHGLTEKIQEVVTWRNTTIRNKSVITDEAMKNLWKMDNLVLTKDKDEILIQRGNIVLYLSGDIDFENGEIRETIINRFFTTTK